MNYFKIYNALIDKAKTKERIRKYDYSYEEHHIIPRCLGGSDEFSNLVLLTPREHFLAHWLLTKIYVKNAKLLYAWNSFCRSSGEEKRGTSRLYEYCRRKFVKFLKDRKEANAQEYLNWAYYAKNKKWIKKGEKSIRVEYEQLQEYLDNGWVEGRIVTARKPASEATKNKISKSNTGNKGYWSGKRIPNSAKEKMVASRIAKGDFKTKEQLELEETERIARVAIKEIECPHCKKIGGKSIMKRWHFDKCKYVHVEKVSI